MNTIWKPKRPSLIGVVHLLALPGAPRWAGSMKEVLRRAIQDAVAYEKGGADALVLENFGDIPFTKGEASGTAGQATVGQWCFAGELRKVSSLDRWGLCGQLSLKRAGRLENRVDVGRVRKLAELFKVR